MSEELEKPKKKRINSKAKGSGFEGSIGKLIEQAIPPLKLRRSQSSGAILGGMNEKFLANYSDAAKSLFVGDVVPTNEEDIRRDHGWYLRFTLECKFYKTPDNINHLMSNTKIRRWFEQATTDALKINKEPCLIFKFNHTDTFVAVDSDLTKIPDQVTNILHFEYRIADKDLPPRKFSVMLLKELLQIPDWWKMQL